MADKLNYYVLFDNYEQGLALHDVLDEAQVENRIAPAPRELEGFSPCGMSLLIEEEHIEAVRRCIAESGAAYRSIETAQKQLQAKRDCYC